MFLQLNHQKLDVFKFSKLLVAECYLVTKSFPSDERFAMTSQIRRAALSVHLNIAEGATRRSATERKRFYEIARGSLIEIDAAFDIAENLNYFSPAGNNTLAELTIKTFKILTGLINATN